MVANYCAKCGAKIQNSAIFCESCGQRVGSLEINALDSKSGLVSKDNIESDYVPIKKNWISAWLLIPTVLAPFREFQMISAAIAYLIISNEWEKNSKNSLNVKNRVEVKNYFIILGVLFAIHLLYFIVAAYYYFFEFDYMF
jgi:hypothetical protein